MKRIARLLLYTGAALLAAGAAVLLAGAVLIPKERSFEDEVVIEATAESVWAVINDRERFPEWQAKVKRVEIIDASSWVEHVEGSPDPLRFSTAVDERPGRMEFHYSMGSVFIGHWKGEVIEQGSSVLLRTTDSYATGGTLSKVMIYAFFDMNGFARDWNESLKKRVEGIGRLTK